MNERPVNDQRLLDALRAAIDSAVFVPPEGPAVVWGPKAEENAEHLRGMGIPCEILSEARV